MLSRKRRRQEAPTIHPRNRYAEKPPDFRLLASLYPSFHPFVFTSKAGRPAIDWTDFNATRELTRILLLHDHGVQWWIPDGQLCPTVPNRSNYIHWIQDLLSSDVITKKDVGSDVRVNGFDIGTGANCIYPLLGASLFGWSFVGSDITEVALECARKNVESNPHLSELIEIRNANGEILNGEVSQKLDETDQEGSENLIVSGEEERLICTKPKENCLSEPPILAGVVRDGEEFDFCMCNPPFFESIGEAGLNPKTACGGTQKEMVYPGGEKAFITRIIEDSVILKQSFQWFTSMVGRKANLKFLVSRLREVGVSVIKTTEFVQGQTARWGLAWSYMTPNKISILSHAPVKNQCSFMLEGLQRQFGASHVLKATESFFLSSGASCTSNLLSFFLDVTFPCEHIDVTSGRGSYDGIANDQPVYNRPPTEGLYFRISVFEQIPGTILVKGSLLNKDVPFSGMFSPIFQSLEESLKKDYVRRPHLQGRT